MGPTMGPVGPPSLETITVTVWLAKRQRPGAQGVATRGGVRLPTSTTEAASGTTVRTTTGRVGVGVAGGGASVCVGLQADRKSVRLNNTVDNLVLTISLILKFAAYFVQLNCTLLKNGGRMVSIGIGEFRANMNRVLQKVQKGEVVTLTLRGAEVARLVPPDYARLSARQELAALRQTAVVGDVLSPVAEAWDAA
jgi:prevent-host-death family protein